MAKEKKETDNVDREIEALRNILNNVENLTEVEKKRVFQYLKNRYANAWPTDYTA